MGLKEKLALSAEKARIMAEKQQLESSLQAAQTVLAQVCFWLLSS
jgi:hypothetical protein